MEVDFDLSNVMFITTANQKIGFPGPLLDRMEVLDYSGYIIEEKVSISNHSFITQAD